MADKPVDLKLKECKTLIIQNVEKNMQGTMIYRYLKDEKIENDIKKYSHNPKDNLITLEFVDHEKALQFYDRANFKDKILIRPFNIYFNVTLSENEMKKYDFDGVNEENLRKMFEIVREIGVCKIYTKYTSNTSSGKVKPQGRLSFIRKAELSENELNALKEKLLALGIKISLHVPDKGLKCALILTNFFTGDINDSEETVETKAKKQASDLIFGVVKDKNIVTNVTAIVKRRPVVSSENTEGTKYETTVKGLVEFVDYDIAVNNFEQIRKGFINIPNAKATLHFYNAEVNTYLSLISNGLVKPEGLTDKQFEDKLVDVFRQINENVIQVNVFPSSNTFVARIYMKSEEAGRDFIVDYDNKRELIVKYYKNNNNIRFDMNVDDNTMKRIKMFKKKAGTIMDSIKNENDKNKNLGKGLYQLPINSLGPMIGNLPNLGLMNQGKPGFGLPQGGMGLPQGGFPMGMIPPSMGPSMGPPPMGFPNMPISGVNPNFNNPQKIVNPLIENRNKIEKFINQKAYLIETAKNDPGFEDNVKKQFFPILKFVIENDLKINANESGSQANIILKNNDISTILDFMKTPVPQTYTKITTKA